MAEAGEHVTLVGSMRAGHPRARRAVAQRARRAVARLVGPARWVLGVVLVGCSPMGPSARSLHVVDGHEVSSPPPPPAAYEAYLRARLAFEHDPPQLEQARAAILVAIRFDPRDPHLWATRAEIEERAGEPDQAAASARRALAIRPGYPLAEQVLARVEASATGSRQAPGD